MLSKSVNGSPRSEIILKSNYLAPTRSLSKLSSKNKQETQRESGSEFALNLRRFNVNLESKKIQRALNLIRFSVY